MITQARLKELYRYNPRTGLFFRLRDGGVCRGSKRGIVRNTPTKWGYVRLWIDDKLYFQHTLAWLYVHGEFLIRGLDHKDTIRTNNRIKNLRRATRSQNNCNKKVRKDNKLGIKGTELLHNGRYAAYVGINGRKVHLGCFASAEEAHACYVKNAKKVQGEFARAA